MSAKVQELESFACELMICFGILAGIMFIAGCFYLVVDSIVRNPNDYAVTYTTDVELEAVDCGKAEEALAAAACDADAIMVNRTDAYEDGRTGLTVGVCVPPFEYHGFIDSLYHVATIANITEDKNRYIAADYQKNLNAYIDNLIMQRDLLHDISEQSSDLEDRFRRVEAELQFARDAKCMMDPYTAYYSTVFISLVKASDTNDGLAASDTESAQVAE